MKRIQLSLVCINQTLKMRPSERFALCTYISIMLWNQKTMRFLITTSDATILPEIFFMKHLKFSSERCQISSKWAVLGVWLLWLKALLDLNDWGCSALSIPKTRLYFLWTRKDCPLQCVHDDVPVRQNSNCGYIVIATSATATPVLLCPALHTLGFFPPAAKKQLVWTLK